MFYIILSFALVILAVAIRFGTLPMLRYIAGKTDRRKLRDEILRDRHGRIVGVEQREW